MKKTILLLAGISLLFALEAFKPAADGYIELKNNAVLGFSDGSVEKGGTHSYYIQRGAYDKSAYELLGDSAGNIILTNVHKTEGQHQSELFIKSCYGSISCTDNTTRVKGKTDQPKLYLIGLNEPCLVDSFAPEVVIEFRSQTLNGKACRTMVMENNHTHLIALPVKAKIDDVWSAVHPDNTIGLFKHFEIQDKDGKKRTMPDGDFLLIGGATFTLSDVDVTFK